MSDLNRLLCVIDIEAPTHLAIERAAYLAPRLDAPIELFACCYDEHIAGTKLFDSSANAAARETLVTHARDELERLAAPLRERGLAVETYACWGRPKHEAVVQRVGDRPPRLVLHDCQHHNAISRAIFDHDDWQLVRTCPAPLLLVKTPRGYATRPKIWAAVDPMQRHDKPATLDRKILDTASALTASLGGELNVVHAYDPAAALSAAAASTMAPVTLARDDITEHMRDTHEQALSQLTEGLGLPPERVHNLQGSTRQVLPGVCIDHYADVLVMGAIARDGLKKLVIGSTAQRVLDRVPCDVLIVRP